MMMSCIQMTPQLPIQFWRCSTKGLRLAFWHICGAVYHKFTTIITILRCYMSWSDAVITGVLLPAINTSTAPPSQCVPALLWRNLHPHSALIGRSRVTSILRRAPVGGWLLAVSWGRLWAQTTRYPAAVLSSHGNPTQQSRTAERSRTVLGPAGEATYSVDFGCARWRRMRRK